MSPAPRRAHVGLGAALLPGLVVGAVLGLGLGWLLWGSTGKAPVAAPAAAEAPPPSKLPVQLGRMRQEGDDLVFPVAVQNTTGHVQPSLKATCAFYDVADRLLGSGSARWTGVEAGGTVSDNLRVKAVRYHEVDHYGCRGAAG